MLQQFIIHYAEYYFHGNLLNTQVETCKYTRILLKTDSF